MNVERILIVKLADIGDAVLALPAIQGLRDRFPDSQIDVLTTPAGSKVFDLAPGIDHIKTLAKHRFDYVRGLVSPRGIVDLARLTLDLRRSRYSAVVILHHLTTAFGARKYRALARATGAPVVAGLNNGRGDFLTHSAIDYGFGNRTEWEYGLAVVDRLGAGAAARRPRLALPESAVASAQSLLASLDVSGPYFVVHPEVGEFSSARGWPLDRFVSVARQLHIETGLTAVFVGTDSSGLLDRSIATSTGIANLSGKTSFAELCAIVSEATLVVGCDSSVVHLAAAFDRPSVALFGPSNIGSWKPYGAEEYIPGGNQSPDSPALALHLDLPCSPCLYTGFRLGRPQGCPERTCMMNLQAESLAQAARIALLNGR
jgi:ADP-heptose:LPS heptosyltransferase